MTGSALGMAVSACVLALAAAGLGHWLIRRAERRVPIWLTRRTLGPQATHPDPVFDRAVRFAVLLPKLALWLGVLWYVSSHVPPLHAGRDWLVRASGQALAAPLFTMNERSYSATDLLLLPLVLGGVWLVVGAVTRLIQSQVLRVAGVERAGQETLGLFLRYLLTILGALIVLQAWGIDVRSIAIVASVLGVGIGFGLQNLANNFVSGLAIGLERPIKPGDFVSVGQFQGTVERIGARSTVIVTNERVTILVPNSKFLENEVVNWSYGDPTSRIHVPVGVAYGTNVADLRAVLLEAARSHPDVLADPRPRVEFRGFGDSALLFELEVWTRDPRHQKDLVSDLNYRIEADLRHRGITIPFPQRDLHLRSPELAELLTALASRHFSDAELAAARVALEARRASDGAGDAGVVRAVRTWDDEGLTALTARMRAPGGLTIRDRRHLLTIYPRCFLGREAVDWLVAREGLARNEAERLGQRLVECGVIHHVLDEHPFLDGNYFYRFRDDDPGAAARKT